MADVVAWVAQARPAATREVAAHDKVTYWQKASLVYSPCHLMLIWSNPFL